MEFLFHGLFAALFFYAGWKLALRFAARAVAEMIVEGTLKVEEDEIH